MGRGHLFSFLFVYSMRKWEGDISIFLSFCLFEEYMLVGIRKLLSIFVCFLKGVTREKTNAKNRTCFSEGVGKAKRADARVRGCGECGQLNTENER